MQILWWGITYLDYTWEGLFSLFWGTKVPFRVLRHVTHKASVTSANAETNAHSADWLMSVFVNELAPPNVRSQQGQCVQQCRRIMKDTLVHKNVSWYEAVLSYFDVVMSHFLSQIKKPTFHEPISFGKFVVTQMQCCKSVVLFQQKSLITRICAKKPLKYIIQAHGVKVRNFLSPCIIVINVTCYLIHIHWLHISISILMKHCTFHTSYNELIICLKYKPVT